MARSLPLALCLIACLWLTDALQTASAPATLEFAVIGDSGRGNRSQRRVARQMANFNPDHPWEFVLMLGDNIYNDGDPEDFDRKFKNVYRDLREAGVRFHATLGNHDRIHPDSRRGMAQVEDEAFGYVGKKDEYVFEAGPELADGRRLARFLCLNSEAWIEEISENRTQEWKVRLKRLQGWLSESHRYRWNFLYMHHPLYAFSKSRLLGIINRGHGPSQELRAVLEPEIIGRVDVVFSGHEHFYQKIKPQTGIHYFISGGAARIRRGVLTNHPEVEFGAGELHFVDVHLSEDTLTYQAINVKGRVIHSGAIRKPP